MKIYLTGFMGCGKSSLGKELSNKLGFTFFDLDEIIEKKAGCSVSEIFQNEGENKFREIEHECLKETFLLDNIVIATGGGTPCFYNNMEMINFNGISVYIKLNSGILSSRLYANKSSRPLLNKFLKKEDLQKYVEKCLEEREQFYIQSKYVIKSKNINAKKIIEIIGVINQQ